MKTRYITQAAVTAAVYVILVYIFQPISFGIVQFRISESLTVLPAFGTYNIFGLFIGCLISNVFFSGHIIDIIFGSLATLLAGFLSYKWRHHKILVPLPPVLVNALVVGFYLPFIITDMTASPFVILSSIGSVFLGQTVACYVLGLPLMFLLEKYNKTFPLSNK